MAENANFNLEDNVLVGKCQLGDSVAMETLIIKYQNSIYNLILKICGNTDDAAELTQDAFVKAIENIDGFLGKSSFYTWLFRIAVNITLNYCKRSLKLGLTSIDAETNKKDNGSSLALKDCLSDEGSPDPLLMAQNKEICQLVMRALMKLDDNQRTVIVLRDIEGMSYAEIADVLEVELGTVKSRISRARSNLRELMEAVIK